MDEIVVEGEIELENTIEGDPNVVIIGGSMTIDSELSEISTNAVQNKVITSAINNMITVEGKKLIITKGE